MLSDTGGIQEEAPALGKPVLVLRKETERTEGIEAGTAILVGTDKENIVKEASALIENPEYYNQISLKRNPYGSGDTSKRIAEIINQEFRDG